MGAAEFAYHAIRSRISAGDFSTGYRLREEDLAEIIGVSRTPVREALRRLAGEGLVEASQHRGFQVAKWDDQDLEEIFGLRALLEGYGARLAATRLTDEAIAELRGLADAMAHAAEVRSDGYRDEIAILNNQFHQAVLDGTGNLRLIGLLGGLVQIPLVRRTFERYDEEHLRRSIAHHIELVAAFEARDAAWAEPVMRSHILAARNVFL